VSFNADVPDRPFKAGSNFSDLEGSVRSTRILFPITNLLTELMSALRSSIPDWIDVDRYQVAQVDAAARLAPFSAASSGATVFVIVLSCWRSGPHLYLAGLFITIIALVGLILAGCASWKRTAARPAVASRAIRFSIVSAGALGLCWGTMPLALFAAGGADGRLLITGTVTGLICTGVVVAPLVRAALAFMIPIILGSFLALAETGVSFFIFVAALLAFYAMFVSFSAIYLSRLFQDRLAEQLRVEDQSATIRLLLREFEHTASDWLWRTDRIGRLKDVSARFAVALDAAYEELEQADFLETLRRLESDKDVLNRDEIDRLSRCIAERTHFRDCIVRGIANGERRWWSFTGAPEFDGDGTFLGYRGVASDVTEAQASAEKIAYLASHDMLTGLPNRASFEQFIAGAFTALSETGHPFAVLYLDLDGFKAVNDTWGHPAGDALLRAASGRLRSCVRDHDRIARIGGDEFAILHRSGDTESAGHLARRIIEHLSTPFQIDTMDVNISVSIGIGFAPKNGTSMTDLLKNCDQALYEAKLAGRKRFRICSV
jgi:diguanylate cyclase (GGDEF)-like protein